VPRRVLVDADDGRGCSFRTLLAHPDKHPGDAARRRGRLSSWWRPRTPLLKEAEAWAAGGGLRRRRAARRRAAPLELGAAALRAFAGRPLSGGGGAVKSTSKFTGESPEVEKLWKALAAALPARLASRLASRLAALPAGEAAPLLPTLPGPLDGYEPVAKGGVRA
jgi:hypothetical protein